MPRNISRGFAIAAMAIVATAASAHAQSWVTIPMPIIQGWGGTVLNSVAPYALGIPPVLGRNSHYESNLEQHVKGFRFRGDATVIGTGTSYNNTVAAFFNAKADYTGDEVGLAVNLNQGGQMILYQCGSCNTGGQQWIQSNVWATAGDYYEYEILINSDGSFTFNVVSTVYPYQTIHTQQVAKATFLKNFYDTAGYVTITAQYVTNDGGNWQGSVLHADQIDVWRSP